MRNMLVPRFDVPELMSEQEDMKRFYEIFHEVGDVAERVESRQQQQQQQRVGSLRATRACLSAERILRADLVALQLNE